jgi:hypothetical protein
VVLDPQADSADCAESLDATDLKGADLKGVSVAATAAISGRIESGVEDEAAVRVALAYGRQFNVEEAGLVATEEDDVEIGTGSGEETAVRVALAYGCHFNVEEAEIEGSVGAGLDLRSELSEPRGNG